MLLVRQDAINAGCCADGIDSFAQGRESVSVEEALESSTCAYRRYILRTILLKTRLSVPFAEFCAAAAAAAAARAAAAAAARATAAAHAAAAARAHVAAARAAAAAARVADAADAADTDADTYADHVRKLRAQNEWILGRIRELDK